MARVLVVDDAIFLRASIRRMLEANGHVVAGEAKNGIEGVAEYALTKPDVVILDVTMPDMDGVEAMKRIKELDPAAKVIICTALGHQQIVAKAIEHGAKGFIVKPFDEERLIKTIEKVCG